jgi:predicted transcriptional regulator of viral defense system
MPDTIARTLALPMGFKVTFKFTPTTHDLQVEWEPAVPSISSPRHRRKFIESYQAARREFFADVATSIGGSIAVADLTGEMEIIQPGARH